MPAVFDESGLRFQYPENWKLVKEASEEGWTLIVQSPETAFFLLTLREDSPDPQVLVDTALTALREDYEDLEAESAVDSLAGLPAIGHDIRFFSLDLTNTCWTRSMETEQGTILLMCQCTDLESEINQTVLRAMCSSLRVDE
ncbi:hypothetical protein BH10PLA2_BH10PLA2_22620 [soil metagenome]